MLDIFSHWFQMYATLASGSTTHKDIHSSSFIVRYYYQHRMFMGFCCICVEVLLLSFYLLRWPQYRSASYGAATLGLPLAFVAALDDVPVLKELLINYAGLEVNAVPVVAVIALVVLPGAAIKQFINVVQFRTAADQLAALDCNNKANNKKSTPTGTGTRRGRST
jgi:CDP-diacylglycerol--inositol 3-phosphatidyltransferase